MDFRGKKVQVQDLTEPGATDMANMAKTIASGVGITNAWLAEQILLSIKILWAELAPLR